MSFYRRKNSNYKKLNRGRWTAASSKRAHGAKAQLRIERAEAGWVDPKPRRVPVGQYLGTITWAAVDGQVRRWIARQGPRANNITVTALVAGKGWGKAVACGWDHFMKSLRKALSAPKREHVSLTHDLADDERCLGLRAGKLFAGADETLAAPHSPVAKPLDRPIESKFHATAASVSSP